MQGKNILYMEYRVLHPGFEIETIHELWQPLKFIETSVGELIEFCNYCDIQRRIMKLVKRTIYHYSSNHIGLLQSDALLTA